MRRYSTLLIAFMAVAGLMIASNTQAQKKRMKNYETALRKKMDGKMRAKPGWKCQATLMDSNDREGQDVELLLTMPINDFMEFAPVAALEAAAIPHNFPVVFIFLRDQNTRRVGRIAFSDAEPIAGRYLAGDKDAINEMKDAIIWH